MIYRTTTAIVIFGLLAYILFLTQCKKDKPCPPSPGIVKVDTQKIINDYISGWEKPKPDIVIRKIVKRIPVEAPQPDIKYRDTGHIVYLSDSVADLVLSDYFTERVYNDTIKLMKGKLTTGWVAICDTITKNQISARMFEVKDTSTTITKTTTVTEQPKQVYFGGGAYFPLSKYATVLIPGVHMDIGYINKKGQHFKLDVQRTQNDWLGGFSFYSTIKFRKRH